MSFNCNKMQIRICILFSLWNIILANNSTLEKLNKFGYEGDLREAILKFQEYNQLPLDGELNNATLTLLETPRCGIQDTTFRTFDQKWEKNIIKWHYSHVNSGMLHVAQTAFDTWSNYSSLTFKRDIMSPDIIISNKRGKHLCTRDRNMCASEFDGKGGIYAHAAFPNRNNTPLEIHVDMDEEWYLKIDKNTSRGQINLYSVLLHEIGHTLGIHHTNDRNAIMYSYYGGLIELNADDILAIRSLYGEIKPTSKPTPSTTSIPPNKTFNAPQLCNNLNVNTFLVINDIIFIFYEEWVWVLNMKTGQINRPQLIRDWLTFLPRDFNSITSIYQRPSGEIIFFISQEYYMIEYSSLNLLSNYPKSVSEMGLPQNSKIHAIVNFNAGKTYIFYNEIYYAEIDECTLKKKHIGVIYRDFSNIPNSMDSAFRYTNGRIYFFKDNIYYEYDEFINTLVKAEKNYLSVFNVNCLESKSNHSKIIEKLKKGINELEKLI